MTPTDPRILTGDLLDVLPTLPDASIDAIVTDPPYGLEFMGKEWDRFRLDDPGTLRNRGDRAAGGTWLAAEPKAAIPQAGRVTYGAGSRPQTSRCPGCGKRDQFRNPHACPEPVDWIPELIHPHQPPPTSIAFAEWVRQWALELYRVLKPGGHVLAFGGTRTHHRLAVGLEDAGFDVRDTLAWLYGTGFPKNMNLQKALTKTGQPPELAAQWAGWGTALKPAHEPITVARRPPLPTIVANVAREGTGALNLAACRVPYRDAEDLASALAKNPGTDDLVTSQVYGASRPQQKVDPDGRWPTNVLLGHAADCLTACAPGCPVDQLDHQDPDAARYFPTFEWDPVADDPGFLYTPKPEDSERSAGLDRADGNDHPTVKPVALMRWLVALVTPQGGTVLDPFLGSGTTAVAAELDGTTWLGIEQDPTGRYQAIASARVAWATSTRHRGHYTPTRRRVDPDDQPALF